MNRQLIVHRTTEELRKAEKFLNTISPNRAATYSDWIKVGQALYNVSQKSEAGLELWIRFSSAHHTDTECISVWTTQFQLNEHACKHVLAHFARIDNPAEHQKIVREYTEPFLSKSLDGGHHDLAKALFEICGHEFVWANRAWYHLPECIKMKDDILLLQKISNELIPMFVAMREKAMREKNDRIRCLQNDLDNKLWTKQIGLIDRKITDLKKPTFKKMLIRECQEVFHIKDFLATETHSSSSSSSSSSNDQTKATLKRRVEASESSESSKIARTRCADFGQWLHSHCHTFVDRFRLQRVLKDITSNIGLRFDGLKIPPLFEHNRRWMSLSSNLLIISKVTDHGEEFVSATKFFGIHQPELASFARTLALQLLTFQHENDPRDADTEDESDGFSMCF